MCDVTSCFSAQLRAELMSKQLVTSQSYTVFFILAQLSHVVIKRQTITNALVCKKFDLLGANLIAFLIAFLIDLHLD